MPTYQYVCSACDEPLEVVQQFTDDALTTCLACGADALRKVYGSVGVVFKGSGFYRNDSRGGAPSSDSSSGKTATGDSATATTTAPAATTTPAASPAPVTPAASPSTTSTPSA